MDKNITVEIEQLKRNYLEAETVHYNEKAGLLKIINTFGAVVAMHDEFTEELHAVKKMIETDKALPIELMEIEADKLRSKIFAAETKREFSEGNQELIDELKEDHLKTCRSVKKIMVALLDDFYPVTGELKKTADSININCHAEMVQIELEEQTSAFLGFISGLKSKISEDFRYINNTFLMLLEHVRELEKALTKEFSGEFRLKEIENFEKRVNNEVGSIVNSFDIHASIVEIKRAVIQKLKNIKEMVSKRKKEELKRSQKTQANINELKKRIILAERDALKMSKKAEYFQMAAVQDGLTGLFNREALNKRIEDDLKRFNGDEECLSLVLFDIDDFKSINDTFGHVAGDKVLQNVALCLKETFRKNDFIARYGGDEFAVVIEGLSGEMGRDKILKFKENFRKKRFFSHKNGDINVNVSVGIAVAKVGDSPNDLIHKADMEMYALKRKKASHAL